MSTKYFDDKAKEWENDPMKIERAFVLAKEIKAHLRPEKTMTAFEFGCGTGLLGYFLRDSFRSITLADNSEGMIGVLKDRIIKERIKNLHPLLTDLLADDPGTVAYDVIFTSMTLHHITNLDAIISKFSKMIRIGGHLCIADLEKEDGAFHENMTNFEGHYGFERKEIEKLLLKNGFRINLYKTFYKIVKTLNNGDRKTFPLFMLVAHQ